MGGRPKAPLRTAPGSVKSTALSVRVMDLTMGRENKIRGRGRNATSVNTQTRWAFIAFTAVNATNAQRDKSALYMYAKPNSRYRAKLTTLRTALYVDLLRLRLD